MTVRLPITGQDSGTWGDILNTFLEVSLNSDGTLKASSIAAAGAEMTSNKGVANGYAGLNGSGVVPSSQLGSGSASSTTFLRGDGSWATPAGGGGSSTLAGDTDVAIASPANNQVLAYNSTSSKWVNQAAPVTSVAGHTGDVTLAESDVTNLTTDLAAKAPTSRQVIAGTGLTGGGDLTADRTLAVSYGTTAGTAAQGNDSRITGAIQSSTATTKGDLLVATASSTIARLGVGSDGQVLTADSTQTTGVKWGTASGSSSAYQFNVQSYGATGSGKVLTDGSMTATSATLTSASASFSAGDVGKPIMVKGAAASGITTLVTTISAVTNSTTVTLAASASTTISSAVVLYGTDDTSGIQQAINAAVTYAQAHSGYAEVLIPPPTGSYYVVAGSLVTGGSTLGNAQITLPVVSASGNKVTLVIKGGENGAAVRHWDQLVPTTGVTLISFSPIFTNLTAQTTSISANGNPSVIGGPTGRNGYGTSGSDPTFNNMLIEIKGLSVLTPHSTNGLVIGAFNFYGVANANLYDVAYGTIGSVKAGDFTNVTTLSTAVSIGLLMPANGNNDSCQLRNIVCSGGYTYGLFATEHTDIHGGTILYCWAGLCLVGNYPDGGSVGNGGTGAGALHAVNATQLSIEACSYHVYVYGQGASGIGPIFHGVVDTEGTVQLKDSTSGTSLAAALGVIRLSGSPSTVTPTAATGLQIFKEQQLPGPVTSPTYTLGTAQVNTYWRPATVIVSGGSGITGIRVSQLAGSGTQPTMTTIYSQSAGALPQMTFRVGPGAWWAIDPSGATAPTMQWILD